MEQENKDKMAFYAILVGVISLFGFTNLKLCNTDEDFIWFVSILIGIISLSVVLYYNKTK
jgi:hypothetical protein